MKSQRQTQDINLDYQTFLVSVIRPRFNILAYTGYARTREVKDRERLTEKDGDRRGRDNKLGIIITDGFDINSRKSKSSRR